MKIYLATQFTPDKKQGVILTKAKYFKRLLGYIYILELKHLFKDYIKTGRLNENQ